MRRKQAHLLLKPLEGGIVVDATINLELSMGGARA